MQINIGKQTLKLGSPQSSGHEATRGQVSLQRPYHTDTGGTGYTAPPVSVFSPLQANDLLAAAVQDEAAQFYLLGAYV